MTAATTPSDTSPSTPSSSTATRSTSGWPDGSARCAPQLPAPPGRVHVLRHLSQGGRRGPGADRRAPVRNRQRARDQARGTRGAHRSHAVQGRRRIARRRVRAGERRACRARPRPLARAPALEKGRHSQNHTSSEHRREEFCGRPASSRRPTRAATGTRLRPAGQRDRSGLHLASRRADRLRARGGGRHRAISAGTHEETPLQLEWPITLRSFNPRITAIQQVKQVDAHRAGPQDQAGNRRARRKPAADSADPDERDASSPRSTARPSHRDRAGGEPGRGTGGRAGAARQAGQRIRRGRWGL